MGKPGAKCSRVATRSRTGVQIDGLVGVGHAVFVVSSVCVLPNKQLNQHFVVLVDIQNTQYVGMAFDCQISLLHFAMFHLRLVVCDRRAPISSG